MGPLDHVALIGSHLNSLALRWVLGGSMASSLMGEARSTNDIDVAVELPEERVTDFVEAVRDEYYAPLDFAIEAAKSFDSFNLIHLSSGFKIDIFCLGESPLDQMQIERRQDVTPEGIDKPIWVTAAPDIILRKLWWYDLGGRVSDRQWRDVLSLLRVQGPELDLQQLRSDASVTGVSELLETALVETTDS